MLKGLYSTANCEKSSQSSLEAFLGSKSTGMDSSY